MIHLKSFINFINEGAWYEGDPGDPPNPNNIKVFLSTKNDPNNPNELLKTVEPNGKNFKDRSGIKVYYGLYPRISYNFNKNEESQLAKILIMDNLKKSEESIFSMAPGEKMEDFIDYTLLKNIKGDINYIVRVGSSADLVSVMSDSLQKIYPNALFIDLNKIKYESGEDGVDWVQYNKQVESELSIERINRRTGRIDPPNSETRNLITAWINARNNELLELIDNEKEPWFHIKSSHVRGSIRSSLRPKYDTSSEAFINAVHHCAFGDENGNLGKMILIDDNANEGIDFRNISNKIYEILAGIIDITKNNTLEVLKSQEILSKISANYKNRNIAKKLDAQLDNFLETDAIDNIKNNIAGYVLYDFHNTTRKKELRNKDFKRILMEITSEVVGPFISKKIEDGLSFQMTGNDYAEAKKNIINRAIEEVQKISTDDQTKIKSDLLLLFNDRLNNILPADIIAERSTKPKYPEAAHLVDGTSVMNKVSGLTGKLFDVDQINGTAKIKYENGIIPPGRISLAFIVAKFDLL